MYPIFSLLRRFASTAIYAEVGATIKIPQGTHQLDLEALKWGSRKGLPLYELKATERTGALAARKISLKENEIAETVKAKDRRYTLIFGPEVEVENDDGTVTRAVRLGVINGIFRYRSGVVERLRRKSSDGAPSCGGWKPPPGALVENR